jgi:Nucleotidyl transferase AbiEii toxin, Type IV TA system
VSQPTRQTTTGRVYLALGARARREGRPTDEPLVLYILERFLYRLSLSSHRIRFVLKGGMLLAAFDERRPTGDVDLLAANISNDAETISRLIREILAIGVDDGVAFEPDGLRAAVIREAIRTQESGSPSRRASPVPATRFGSTSMSAIR